MRSAREQTICLLSPNIPRNVKNGILGKREGVTLVRRDIVVKVAEHLRNAIIEISNSFESKKDQEPKQARIYDFITSREFCRRLESLDKDFGATAIQGKSTSHLSSILTKGSCDTVIDRPSRISHKPKFIF